MVPWDGIEFLGDGLGGVCKVIIVSNPTAVDVVFSCIEVVVGVLTKRLESSSAKLSRAKLS